MYLYKFIYFHIIVTFALRVLLLLCIFSLQFVCQVITIKVKPSYPFNNCKKYYFLKSEKYTIISCFVSTALLPYPIILIKLTLAHNAISFGAHIKKKSKIRLP